MRLVISLCALLLMGVVESGQAGSREIVNISKVEFATVVNVRRLSHQDLVDDKRHGWRLYRHALLGGELGGRYGKGSLSDVGGVLDAVLQHNQSSTREVRLTGRDEISLMELSVVRDNGVRNTIIMQFSAKDIYRPQDHIRLVHCDDGVLVDKML